METNNLWEEKNLTDQNQNLTQSVKNVNENTTTETANDLTKNDLKDIGITNSGIYKIINKVNGKYYVGSSKCFENRWNDHKCKLNHNKHDNSHLQNAWNLYGEDSFEFVKVEFVLEELLIETEQKYLDVANEEQKRGLDTHYNLSYIAGRISHTDEIREKMKKYANNRNESHKFHLKQSRNALSEETKEYIRSKTVLSNKNRIWLEESKEKLRIIMKRRINEDVYKKFRDSRKGRIISEDTRKKLSNASKGRAMKEETRKKLSEINKGQIPWCKGKTLVNDDRVFTWVNSSLDLREICTRNELRVKYNLGVKNKLLSVIRGDRSHYKGWSISNASVLSSSI